MTKTVAERLREIKDASFACDGDVLAFALGRKLKCPIEEKCSNCIGRLASELADTIEAEQAERQLPEGVIWPTYEDGELVKFGDKFMYDSDIVDEVKVFHFYDNEFYLNCAIKCSYDIPMKRPEPEVLDADGVPIKVGDTVYRIGEHPLSGERTVKGIEAEPGHIRKVFFNENGCWANPRDLTHRKPDTFKSVVEEMLTDFDSHDTIELDGYFARLRKLLGGE